MSRATLIVDLDSIDRVFAKLGADAAEDLIWFAAFRIAQAIDADGAVGASGRGRFKVSLFKNVDETTVHDVAGRLHDSLRAPFVVRGTEVFISASIGVALGTPESVPVLPDYASDAADRVKSNGGDATYLLRAVIGRADAA
jgi:GGDEF domain-containing protein